MQTEHQSPERGSTQSVFLGHMAAVILRDDPMLPGFVDVSAQEQHLVRGICALLERCADTDLPRVVEYIDAKVLPHLSAQSMLDLARFLEMRIDGGACRCDSLRQLAGLLERMQSIGQAFCKGSLSALLNVTKEQVLRDE